MQILFNFIKRFLWVTVMPFKNFFYIGLYNFWLMAYIWDPMSKSLELFTFARNRGSCWLSYSYDLQERDNQVP